MFCYGHVCLRRYGRRPRQLIDSVPDVVPSHQSKVHYAARDGLKTSFIFFVQNRFLRLVQ